MTNQEPPVIDLTESFTLVNHRSLANTIIDLDDSLDSPQVRSTAHFNVAIEPSYETVSEHNRTQPRPSTSNRVRTRQSTQTATNTSLRHSTPNSQINELRTKLFKIKAPARQLSESENRQSRDSSPAVIVHCPICFEKIGTNPPASTKCGHVFCLECLERSLHTMKKCPTCRKSLKGATAYHRLYLTTV